MAIRGQTSILKSAALTVGMRWFDRVVGLLSTLILARLLVPEDFGIVAMSSLVIGLVDVLLDLGVHVALIQNKHPSQEHYDTAWTLRAIQTTLATVIVAGCSPFAASYFDEPRLMSVLPVSALGLFIAGIENIGIVTFQKEMRFGSEFRLVFAKRLTAFIVTIAGAWFFRSYWALIAGTLAGRSLGVVLSYRMHPMRPRLSLVKFREIFGVSQWMLVRSIGLYLDGSLHRILVGGRASASILGGYTLASEVSAMPTTEVLAPLNRVLFPMFVRAKHDLKELERLFLLAQGVQAIIAIPASVGLALVAREAVVVLLGEKWLFSVPFVQVLALASVVQAITTSGGYVLLTLGRSRDVALLAWTQVAIFLTLSLVAIPGGGALALAAARLTTVAAGLSLATWLILRAMPAIRINTMVRSLSRPLVATGLMTAALLGLDLPMHLAASGLLIVKISLGMLIYVVADLTLWRLAGFPEGAESYLLTTLRSALRKG